MSTQLPSFRTKVIKGISWSTVATVASQVITILTFIVLGKYFLPKGDFGLVAMVAVLTGLAGLFTEFGLGAALIQKQDADETHRSSIFWLSLLLGGTAYGAFLLLRQPICDFYDRPILYPMISVLPITLVLGAASSVPMSLLRKELRFKAIAIVTIAAHVLSFIIAVAMAWTDWGPWSLIGKAIALSTVSLLGVWYSQAWRPKFIFSYRAIKDIFNFSSSYFGSRAFSYAAVKVDEFMIGKYVGEGGLGLYSNAFKIVLAPISLIKNQVIGVFFPAFSSIHDDKPRVKRIALQLSGLLAMIGFPVLFYITISSYEWILLLLNEDWLEMQLMMVLLSLVAMFEVSIFPGVIFLSQGRADGYFKLMLVTKSLSSIGIITGVLSYGIMGLMIGMLIAAILNFLPYLYFSGRLIDMTVTEQLMVNVAPFLISATAAAIAILSPMLLGTGTPVLASVAIKTLLFFGLVCLGYFAFRPFPFEMFAGRFLQPRTSSTT